MESDPWADTASLPSTTVTPAPGSPASAPKTAAAAAGSTAGGVAPAARTEEAEDVGSDRRDGGAGGDGALFDGLESEPLDGVENAPFEGVENALVGGVENGIQPDDGTPDGRPGADDGTPDGKPGEELGQGDEGGLGSAGARGPAGDTRTAPVPTPPEGENGHSGEEDVQAGRDGQGAEQGDGQAGDDFDDFDAPAPAPVPGPSSSAVGPGSGDAEADDGFGDFGDFEEGDFADEGVDAVEAVDGVGQVEDERFQSLSLEPMPSGAELLDQLTDILAPLLTSSSDTTLNDEPLRSVGGLSQIMVSQSSREAYAQLTTAPMLKPLDWTRSRVRRDHLISMGVPVNLDEVDSHRLSTLPPLEISVNPPTPGYRGESNGHGSGNGNGSRRYSASQKGKGREVPLNSGRNSMPATLGGAGTGVAAAGGGLVNDDPSRVHGLGARPPLNVAKAEELCGIEEEQLSIMSLSRLKRLQDQLVSTTTDASALLAYLLQLKDAQLQDSATYNGMISELIANAAKVKSAQSAAASGGVFRRASARRPNSMSGTTTPGRIGTPTGMR